MNLETITNEQFYNAYNNDALNSNVDVVLMFFIDLATYNVHCAVYDNIDKNQYTFKYVLKTESGLQRYLEFHKLCVIKSLLARQSELELVIDINDHFKTPKDLGLTE